MDQETYLNRKIPKATKKIWAKANGGNRYLELFTISAIRCKIISHIGPIGPIGHRRRLIIISFPSGSTHIAK
jgi:hypothetical protein